MNLLRNLSIKNKIISLIFLVTSIVMLLGFSFVLINNINSFKKEMVSNAIINAKLVGDYCVVPLTFDDRVEAQNVLSKLKTIPNVVNGVVFDEDNKLFAALDKPATLTPPSFKEIPYAKFDEENLHVLQPVFYDNHYYGAIYLVTSTAPLTGKINANILAILTLSVVLMVVCYIMAVKFQRVISKPILDLAHVTEDVSHKADYSIRVQKQGNDEIGLLYDGFNNMLKQIHVRKKERDMVYEKLRVSDARFRSMIERTSDSVFCYEYTPAISTALPEKEQVALMYKGVLVECNAMCAKSYGVENPEQVIGKKMTKLFGSDDGGMDDFFLTVIKNNYEAFDVEASELLKDGSKRYYLHRGQAIVENGYLIRIWGTFRDITESKQAKLAFLESEAKNKALLQASPDLIFRLSGDGEYLDVHGPAGDLMVPAEQLLGKKIPNHLPENQAKLIMKEIRRVLQKEELGLVEYKLPTLKGTTDYFEARISPVAKNEVICIVRNITERKELERRITRINEELEKRVKERTSDLEAVNKELEAFSYSVSHDLRAPLRAINGFSQMLNDEYNNVIDDEGKNYLQRICNASDRMGKLIDDLLELSRITRRQMEFEKVNISQLVAGIADELKLNQPERAVDFKIEEEVNINGDKTLLRVALDNLIRNAWKFTQKKSSAVIEFGVSKNNGSTTCYVKDNGAGFNMDYANKLFGAFQRLHSDKEFEGTGIGLATVQRIIHRHGGKVWAEGKKNEGATFYFSL